MGTLYLVATPIGNLEDITLRALRTLREVPLIAAEDTRHARKLLAHYGIETKLVSFHERSPPARVAELMEALERHDVAVISDAGMPGISDPGLVLVREAAARGFKVVPVPGPSAVTAAVAVSGLVEDGFLFLGFLPRRAGERRRQPARRLPGRDGRGKGQLQGGRPDRTRASRVAPAARVLRAESPGRWAGVPALPYRADGAPSRGVTRRLLAAPPGAAFELRYFELAPGGHTTRERHAHEHVVVCWRGRGVAWVAGETHAVGPGDVVYVAAGEPHQFRNPYGEPFGFLCIVDRERDRPVPVEE